MRVGLKIGPQTCEVLVLDGATAVYRSSVKTTGQVAVDIDRMFLEVGLEYGFEITDVNVDVSPMLAVAPLSDVLAIRISPRPPADKHHQVTLPDLVRPAVAQALFLEGGHDIQGHELAPLNVESLLEQLPRFLAGPARNVAISAVGSTVTDEHETRVAEEVLSHRNDITVTISHDFYSNAFRDRDFTTILNSALIEAGQNLVGALNGILRRHVPNATFAFAKNDGGRAPLHRLAVTPVHALHPSAGLALVGASNQSGMEEAEVILARDDEVTIGNIRRGLPISSSVLSRGFEAGIASKTADTAQHTPNHTHAAARTVVVDLRSNNSQALPNSLQATLTPAEDLALIGCAAAPWTAWIERLERVETTAVLSEKQRRAEEDAKSAAIVFGAHIETATIIESNVFALPYGDPEIVRIRVQAAGEVLTPAKAPADLPKEEPMP